MANIWKTLAGAGLTAGGIVAAPFTGGASLAGTGAGLALMKHGLYDDPKFESEKANNAQKSALSHITGYESKPPEEPDWLGDAIGGAAMGGLAGVQNPGLWSWMAKNPAAGAGMTGAETVGVLGGGQSAVAPASTVSPYLVRPENSSYLPDWYLQGR